MKLYKTLMSVILKDQERYYLINQSWDSLINRDGLYKYLVKNLQHFKNLSVETATQCLSKDILAPIGKQEVWAAGVTYTRSMEARMEESKDSGGADLYDRVYHAERPELFFKAMPHRVSGTGQVVYIRKDSDWNVPEPELTLFISSSGKIQGYTISNDISSRSIEGENALYLPQAKIYERSAALGPCLYIPESTISNETKIEITIYRKDQKIYNDSVQISKIKRSLEELCHFLYRECDFEHGCFLMTGTCLVPPNDFTLIENDIVEISIDGIGTLSNSVGFKK